MQTLLYLIIIVLAASFVAGLLLVIMVKKYYWGPTGVPPKLRYKDKDSDDKKVNQFEAHGENKNH